MRFGTNLERVRKDNGMSQLTLAQMLGLTQQVISGYEKGKCYPNIDVLCKIADIFHVSIDTLLGHVVQEPDKDGLEERMMCYYRNLTKKDKEKCYTIVKTILEDRERK